MGYAKKGSTKSAIAGGVIGVALLVAGCLMGDPSFAITGVKTALGVAPALCCLLCVEFAAVREWHAARLSAGV